MTAKIGVLGEATAVGVGTNVVYTVPTAKAAKVRLQWYINAANTGTFAIRVNGQTVFADTAVASEFSVSAAPVSIPATGVALVLQASNPILATPPTHVLRPLSVDYYLSAGDVVDYVVGVVDLTSINIQVVGVEDDA